MSDHTALTEPSPWIVRWAELAPPGGTVLDLACGGGRHGRLFLQRGHPVTFVDRNLGGVEDLRGTENCRLVKADLEDGSPWPFAANKHFDCVVVTNYLWRPILPRIVGSVSPGGCLLYETFGVGNEVYGKPCNPDFLLQPNELIGAVRNVLTVRAYGHGLNSLPLPAVRQHIAAVRPR